MGYLDRPWRRCSLTRNSLLRASKRSLVPVRPNPQRVNGKAIDHDTPVSRRGPLPGLMHHRPARYERGNWLYWGTSIKSIEFPSGSTIFALRLPVSPTDSMGPTAWFR